MQGQYSSRSVTGDLAEDLPIAKGPQCHELLNAEGTAVENTVDNIPRSPTRLAAQARLIDHTGYRPHRQSTTLASAHTGERPRLTIDHWQMNQA
jgi:hypothetical protein